MTLEAPRLDDRSFQDLVDDAKRYVAERCEGWTDHNVSDPGVTLIEAFAWMTDLMLYRLNRVPERSYLKFLEMIGVTLRPPAPSVVDVDYRLSASLGDDVTIPALSVVSTERTTVEDPILFTLFDEEVIRSATSTRVVRVEVNGDAVDLTASLGLGGDIDAFQAIPEPGDGIYLGFPIPIDRHLVLVSIDVNRIAGHGIDPEDPPLEWQISTADGWRTCERVGRDSTSGMNETGHIELALPDGHTNRLIEDVDSYWLRCRVLGGKRDRYRETPKLVNISASTIGVVSRCVNAAAVDGEQIAESTGVPGQEVRLLNSPVVSMPGEDLEILAHPPGSTWDGSTWVSPAGFEPVCWKRVSNFADSGSEDRHFTLDAHNGLLRFGPEVREVDGSIRRHGAVPEKGSILTVGRYWFGGGERANIVPGAIRGLRSSIPHVSTVRNRHHGRGGVDAETVEEAKRRGPLELRARNRAVTAEDFEYLAKSAASEVSRAKCLEDSNNPGMAAVRVLIVPTSVTRTGPSSLDDLDPSQELLQLVTDRLERARLIGTTVRVEPPEYVGVAVDASVQARDDANLKEVEDHALARLYAYFNPVTGGSDGNGWPFGRGVHVGEAFSVLQSCPGVDVVEELKLVAVDLRSPNLEEQERVDRSDDGIGVYPNELVTSGLHKVDVFHLESDEQG